MNSNGVSEPADTQGPVLRPAVPGDLERINVLIGRAVMTWALPERVKRLALPLYHYDREDLEHLRILVATEGSAALVGVAAWEPADPRHCPHGGRGLLLHGVYVDPDRQGLGLFSLEGKVIGITSAGVRADGAQNLNFAVPVDYVRPLLDTRATPMPAAGFTRKMHATAGPQARGTASRDGGSRGRSDELIGVWTVAHDHGDFFTTFCLGKLYVTADVLGYTNDSNVHVWEVPSRP